MGKNFGKCALCGKECELSYEHIPPRSAFNSECIKPVSGTILMSEEVLQDQNRMPWDMTGLKYQNQQRGMGLFSLCSECNNNTGSWYGDAYVEFARITHFAMRKLSVGENKYVSFGKMHPQRIVKQVLSMFCSINGYEADVLAPIREFIMDRDMVGLDKTKYKLCMYFTKSDFKKYAGFTGVIRELLNDPQFMIVSEITAYPFGFLLYLDPTGDWEYKGVDITHWADAGYDDIRDIVIPWDFYEMNDLFPEHYRTKEEIRDCIDNNRKWVEEHGLFNKTMD